jgi:hypothetical protein
MAQTLWGETKTRQRSRRRKKTHLLPCKPPYSLSGANDCEIIGHTLSVWDLAGCTTCLDCRVRIFCPRCIAKHPQDASAIAMLCERHEAPQESR